MISFSQKFPARKTVAPGSKTAAAFANATRPRPSSPPGLWLGLLFLMGGAGLRGQGSGAKVELIGRYDVPQPNRILTEETPAFTGLAVAHPPARHPVKLDRITHPAVIPERGNRPALASGRVAIPGTADKALPMVSYQHGTVFSKRALPSFPDESPETRLMSARFAGRGYVVFKGGWGGDLISRKLPRRRLFVPTAVLGPPEVARGDAPRATCLRF
jgi:hypothetical protein